MFRPTFTVSRTRPWLLALCAAVLVAGVVRLAASDPPKLTSGWRDREVHVDGVDEEWRDIRQPLKGEHVAVGFLNDEDALYFCLVTNDKNTVRKISRLGLILWIDPAGGKKKTFGVRFPVVYGPSSAGRRQGQPTAPGDAPGEGQAVEPPGQRDIEILGPGRHDVRDIENGQSGVTARYRIGTTALVYELRLPLRKGPDSEFAPDIDAGAAVRLELQTPEWRGPVPPVQPGRGGPMIGIGVGGPGGGVFFPGPDTALLRPLDVTADLRLAAAPR